ncbi:hypothetical protein FHS10_002408 [Mucilaginibacter dorajii]|nr:hypothetical protein [Mucilaginibacter dorajii]
MVVCKIAAFSSNKNNLNKLPVYERLCVMHSLFFYEQHLVANIKTGLFFLSLFINITGINLVQPLNNN